MVTGLVLIMFGILVAVYPQILVGIISAGLIVTGLGILLASWRWRRLRRKSTGSFFRWMIRF